MSKAKKQGPAFIVEAWCTECEFNAGEPYACQGDTGWNYRCEHPSFEKPMARGTSARTPDWCPFAAVFVPEASKARVEALEADLDLQTKLTTKLMGEQNRTLERLAEEEEGATEKAGMLADLADILFEDERRALDHGYEGLLDRAREVVSERGVVDRVQAMGAESLSPDLFSALLDVLDALLKTRKALREVGPVGEVGPLGPRNIPGPAGPSFQIDDVAYSLPTESTATAESVAAALREQGIDAFVDDAGVLSWRIPAGAPSRVEIAKESEKGEGR